ncbi:hypothetical protein L1987_08034 [Smallanthus sonchifolius]|uniref:Uncharacterized protein n=1 Tax=Smallanthus sonchifolius TaxID=185202 RepID=A0ACB9JLA1_9ASTR|nr:hypothetical protein L1987_08034 [Smallanthus sonchifolius]
MVDPLLPSGSPLPRAKPVKSNAILPQYNIERIKNKGSLQPFTKFNYDHVDTDVIYRGESKPVRVYVPHDFKLLSDEDILAINAVLVVERKEAASQYSLTLGYASDTKILDYQDI